MDTGIEPDGWQPPTPGPPAWYDFAGRRFYRLPTGYYAARDDQRPERLHMAIWENVTGRTIPAGHVIHHLDHDPENNAPGNLRLMRHGDHDRHHRAGLKRNEQQRANIHAGILASWERRPYRQETCQWCDGSFQTRGLHARYCSKQCSKLALQRERGLPVFIRTETPCQRCGAGFTPKDSRSKFCGATCRDADRRDRLRASASR